MHMKYQIYLYLLVWFTIFIEEYAFFAYVIFIIYGNFFFSVFLSKVCTQVYDLSLFY